MNNQVPGGQGRIREICTAHSAQILKGHVSVDHVHIFVYMPHRLPVSKIAQYIKGKTSRKLLEEFPGLRKEFRGQHFWSRGYFAVTSGSITDEMIMDYIASQDEDSEKRGDEFTVIDVQNQDASASFLSNPSPLGEGSLVF
jgi:putative transposase